VETPVLKPLKRFASHKVLLRCVVALWDVVSLFVKAQRMLNCRHGKNTTNPRLIADIWIWPNSCLISVYTAVQSLNITSLAKDCLLRSTGVTTYEPLLAMYVTRTRIKLGQHWWFYVICFSHSEGSGVIGYRGAPTKHHLSVLWRTLFGNPSCHYYINYTTHKATPCPHILYDICIYDKYNIWFDNIYICIYM